MSEASRPTDRNGTTNPSPPPTQFERIGGAPAVKTAVALFYDQILADPHLAPYFTDTDMQEQRRHMVLMLTTVLGGPNAYTGRALTEAHQALAIPVAHYRLVGEHLVTTLTKLDLPPDVIDDVRAVLVQVQDQVVSGGNRVGA